MAAWREANEETAQTLRITLEQVLEAERLENYVDYLNPKTGMFYRMYYLYLDAKPEPTEFVFNAVGQSHVEMVEWRYFTTNDVLNNQGGVLPGTDDKLYETTCVRLELLKSKKVRQV